MEFGEAATSVGARSLCAAAPHYADRLLKGKADRIQMVEHDLNA